MDNRAQSEVLGFVIIFGIVMLSIGIVTVSGYAGLEDTREAEQINNAIVAFDVLADNIDDLVSSGAPSRSTEFKLSDAQLSLTDPVTIRVTVTSAADPNQNATYDLEPHPIVYDALTDTKIVYSSGSVIRVDREDMVMLRKPAFVLTAERTMLPIIETRSRTPQHAGGNKRVQVRTVRSVSPLLAAETTPQNVTVEIRSPRSDAWEQYLSANDDLSCSRPGPEVIRCSLITDQVYVVAVRTDVIFE